MLGGLIANSPTFSNEYALANRGLINIDDTLALKHLVQQKYRILLSLNHCPVAVCPRIDGLQRFEF